MKTRRALASLALLTLVLGAGGGAEKPATIRQDFKGKDLGRDWKVSGDAFKVEEGELRGKGAGYLESTRLLTGDLVLAFDARTEEKANIEVRLFDRDGKRALMTFAFLGRYHTVLDGVKCAILKDDRFVSVSPRMWIFPGRFFSFEVRRVKGTCQMFLNKQPGPSFEDDQGEIDAYRLRIEYSPEGKGDALRLDNVEMTFTEHS